MTFKLRLGGQGGATVQVTELLVQKPRSRKVRRQRGQRGAQGTGWEGAWRCGQGQSGPQKTLGSILSVAGSHPI